jgi:hypothetical protein
MAEETHIERLEAALRRVPRDVMPTIVAPLAAEQAAVRIRPRDGFGAELEEPASLFAAPIAILAARYGDSRATQFRPSGWVDFDQGRHGGRFSGFQSGRRALTKKPIRPKWCENGDQDD